jgi:hypothetical protein
MSYPHTANNDDCDMEGYIPSAGTGTVGTGRNLQIYNGYDLNGPEFPPYPAFTTNPTTMEDGSAALSMNPDSNNFQQQSTDRTQTWVSTQEPNPQQSTDQTQGRVPAQDFLYNPQQGYTQSYNYPLQGPTQSYNYSQPSADETQDLVSQQSDNPRMQTWEEAQDYYQQEQSAQTASSTCQGIKKGKSGKPDRPCGLPALKGADTCWACRKKDQNRAAKAARLTARAAKAAEDARAFAERN